MENRVTRVPYILLVVTLLVMSVVPPGRSAVPTVSATNSTQNQKHKTAPAKDEPKAAAVPFRAGEQLEYCLSWATFLTAATVRLSVVERRTLYGWDAWHFRATGNSEQPLRALFTIDDEFDSYTDAATFTGHQFEMYLDELGRKDKNIMELTPQGSVPRGSVASVIVPPATRDPLDFLESIRAFDWERYPELRVPVFDGKNLYDIHATRDALDEKISVPGITCDAARIGIHVFASGKELDHTKIAIWLQRDGARIPVAIQAELPLGTFRMELSSFDATAKP